MASITVENLTEYNVSGMNLFNDSENFMMELSDDELNVYGGLTPGIIYTAILSSEICATAVVITAIRVHHAIYG
jgi:hypothetical protein